MKKIFLLAFNAIVFLLLFIFALKNWHPVTLQFFSSEWQMPMIILIFIVFGLGCFVGAFAMVPYIWKQRKKGKKALKEAQATNLVKVD